MCGTEGREGSCKRKKGESFSALIVREAREQEIQISRRSNVFAGAGEFLHKEQRVRRA
jgi:hypothetical protein